MEKTGQVPESTGWTIRLLGLHGVAIAVVPTIIACGRMSIAVIAAVLAFGPWTVWAFGPNRVRGTVWISYGLVPGGLLAAVSLAEGTGPSVSGAVDATRIAMGVLAQLAATVLSEPRLERAVEIETSASPSLVAAVPTSRARRRAALVGIVTLASAATILIAPFTAPSSTAAERAFASVSASVLAATLALTVLPTTVRRDRGAAIGVRARVLTAVILLGLAGGALVLEAMTRPG